MYRELEMKNKWKRRAAPLKVRQNPKSGTWSKKRALVLEDEAALRRIFTRVLTSLGFEVVAYESPAEVPSWEEVDIILSDNRMPVMSGLEYVRTLKSAGRRMDTIALLSADWNSDELVEANSLGCALFHKPLSITILSDWVAGLNIERVEGECRDLASSVERNQEGEA